ncbi:MAG: 2,3-bisphosphoglycerate-independent phosphoglycerate mutase [Acidobacteria bacterium]|nr:2,3-bisphosphoglycerate-independent phosphoglycerate mutase [Acidobacteriota bacterium]
MMKRGERRPVILLVMDGWGVCEANEGNAVALAETPNFALLTERYPMTVLGASGPAVGLPEGQMGNSEVGHLNLGAGRVVFQDITRIDRAIESGGFASNPVVSQSMMTAKYASLHLLGLVSDGGVHSHIRHLFALLETAGKAGVSEAYVHMFTDGRDTSPTSGITFARALQDRMDNLGLGRIASVSGRYYAMDRDHRWERTEKAFRAIVEGEGNPASSAEEAIRRSYDQGITDEFLVPSVVMKNGKPLAPMQPEDAALFFNFRADRARQLTRALTQPDFTSFGRMSLYPNCATLTEYDRTFDQPVAFKPIILDRILAKILAQQQLKNLRIAETEKYAHVTYFFNGGEEPPFAGERRVLIPSPKVATYDLKPEMSAFEVTDRLLAELDAGEDDCVILNYANADMVGHTGVISAARRAVEAVDECLGRVYGKVREKGGVMMVTADHGNAEQMIDPATGGVHTAHTTNPVPFILVDDDFHGRLRSGCALQDVAPTLLHYFGLEKPPEMTGSSLLESR